MQIIIMHSRFTQAKSITLGVKHFAFALLGLFAAILIFAGLFTSLLLNAAQSPSSWTRAVIPNALVSMAEPSAGSSDRYVKENLNVMAVKLGEMQAQLIRLDALGERVQGLAGVKPEEFNFKEMPGRGGADIPNVGLSKEWTIPEFQHSLDGMNKELGYRLDYLNVVESKLMSYKLQARLLPTTMPVNIGYNASGFGRRLDPLSGHSAFHEGIDFSAPTGTPIVAAAGGVVIAAEYHPEFGNMLEIDHGGDLMTRYAHASKLLVKVGDIVRRGQLVANIGSTGRSTGAHLHFEVRIKGVPQNPHKFLNASNANSSPDTSPTKTKLAQ